MFGSSNCSFPLGFMTEILYSSIFLSIPTSCTLTSSSFICSFSKRPHYIVLPMYMFCMIIGIISFASLRSNTSRASVFYDVGSMFLNTAQIGVMLRKDKSATAKLDDHSSKPTRA
jgi:Na+/glutamate symporter